MRRSVLLAFAGAFALAPTAFTAVIVVDTLERSVSGPALCDIGDAMNAANEDQISGGCQDVEPSGADVVDLTGLTGVIEIEGNLLPVIQEDVTLRGPGADLLTIDGGSLSEVLVVENGTLTVEGLTIANGNAGRGGCITVDDAGLILRDSRVTGCVAFNGGGIAVDSGSSALVERSLIDGNSTSGNSGAGIVNGGSTLEIVSSTISGNFTTGEDRVGGGVATFAPEGPGTATTHVRSSTIADNGADTGGNVFTQESENAVTILSHTLLADSRLGGDCGGRAIVSEGYNLSTDASCALDGIGDLPDTVAGITAALVEAGGSTAVHALEEGSAAIDGGNAAGCTLASGAEIALDQRGPGFARRSDGNLDGSFECDIGAYEVQTVPEPFATAAGAGALLVLAIRRRARAR
jgi:hypothetical protein